MRTSWKELILDQALILATVNEMVSAFHAGDIDGIMRSYEADAVVVGEPDAPVSGTANLRSMFRGFIEAKARFSFRGHEVIQAGDIALHLTPWHMTGQAADGTKLESTGLSVAVLRRRADGKWLFVIDHPFGDFIQNR
jgi:uncharacterized protein (TIGR02246 family)